jgi:nicotinamide-nucleotide amidase
MTTSQRVDAAATELATILDRLQRRVVLAESCTAGLACAALGQNPGISQWLCGSAVTYREATKTNWLGVKEDTLRFHSAVSREVAIEMAMGALQATPEADFAASITGHLGPNAPAGFDGLVFIGVARRLHAQSKILDVSQEILPPVDRPGRQREAAVRMLTSLRNWIVRESSNQQT